MNEQANWLLSVAEALEGLDQSFSQVNILFEGAPYDGSMMNISVDRVPEGIIVLELITTMSRHGLRVMFNADYAPNVEHDVLIHTIRHGIEAAIDLKESDAVSIPDVQAGSQQT